MTERKDTSLGVCACSSGSVCNKPTRLSKGYTITWPNPWHAMHFQRSKTLPASHAAQNHVRQAGNRRARAHTSGQFVAAGEREHTHKNTPVQQQQSRIQKTSTRLPTSFLVYASARTCRAANGAKTIACADCGAALWRRTILTAQSRACWFYTADLPPLASTSQSDQSQEKQQYREQQTSLLLPPNMFPKRCGDVNVWRFGAGPGERDVPREKERDVRTRTAGQLPAVGSAGWKADTPATMPTSNATRNMAAASSRCAPSPW